MSGAFSFRPPPSAVLVVAHPGHELRVHGWLETARPEVHVLTDGSGHGPHPRLASTTTVLEQAAASCGGVYGRFSDRELYEAMLGGHVDLFLALADEVVEALVARDAGLVVCDAIEGYNPSHDVCRLLTGAAVHLASRRLGRSIAAFDFPLVARPDACPAHLRSGVLRLELDADALARKLQAADRYPELRAEVTAALEALGEAAFQVESLRPHDADSVAMFDVDPPFYERHGRQRVAEGVYRDVLTFREHVRPIADALREAAVRELVP
jgi:hypothetical protein